MLVHAQILKTRGPDKELREPVRVSAPIRPKAAVCVCRQAHRFLRFIQQAHTLALPLFFTQTSSWSCPAWLTCCFRQVTQKAMEAAWKDRHLLHFLHHTRRGMRGEEQKQTLNALGWAEMAMMGKDDSSRISPQTSKQPCKAITEYFDTPESTIRVFIYLSGQSKQRCHLLVYSNWAGREGGASRCNLGDLQGKDAAPSLHVLITTPRRRRNRVTTTTEKEGGIRPKLWWITRSVAVRVPTQLTQVGVSGVLQPKRRACSGSNIFFT